VGDQPSDAALKHCDAALPVDLLVLDFKSQRSRHESAKVEETQAAFVLLIRLPVGKLRTRHGRQIRR
jgi:hypothetical protein